MWWNSGWRYTTCNNRVFFISPTLQSKSFYRHRKYGQKWTRVPGSDVGTPFGFKDGIYIALPPYSPTFSSTLTWRYSPCNQWTSTRKARINTTVIGGTLRTHTFTLSTGKCWWNRGLCTLLSVVLKDCRRSWMITSLCSWARRGFLIDEESNQKYDSGRWPGFRIKNVVCGLASSHFWGFARHEPHQIGLQVVKLNLIVSQGQVVLTGTNVSHELRKD